MPTNKSLIVLQENSGQVPLDPSIPPAVRQQITFKFTCVTVATLLAVSVLVSAKSISAKSEPTGPPAVPQKGEVVLKSVRTRTSPLGLEAARIFNVRKKRTYKENVRFSNSWIMKQIAFYDRADEKYKEELKEMMVGTPAGGIGMRAWITEPKNEAFWNPTIQRNVGNVGYARVVALNAAFPPGSAEWRLVYGGDRRYDPDKNTLTLNETSFPEVDPDKAYVTFPHNASLDEQFDVLVKFSDAIRQQMFAFYNAFAAGKIRQEQVRRFNQAYVIAGGCAMAATAPKKRPRSLRYLAAMNLMAKAMGELGFKVAI